MTIKPGACETCIWNVKRELSGTTIGGGQGQWRSRLGRRGKVAEFKAGRVAIFRRPLFFFFFFFFYWATRSSTFAMKIWGNRAELGQTQVEEIDLHQGGDNPARGTFWPNNFARVPETKQYKLKQYKWRRQAKISAYHLRAPTTCRSRPLPSLRHAERMETLTAISGLMLAS